jgi:hypothetical protein
MTVRTMLYDMGARLVNGKVVDANGKELCFFYVQRNHRRRNRDVIEENRRELREVEKKYRVIRMHNRPLEE